MNDKQYRKIINNPRHISGIYNYCDSWCERCRFTLRCANFAMQAAEGEDRHGGTGAGGADLWPRLESLQPLANQFLKADHPGIPEKKKPTFKSVANHINKVPVGVAAKRYLEFAHDFVKAHQTDHTTWQLLPTEKPLEVTPAEAFDIINWYHTTIPIKLARALRRDERDEEMENAPELKDMPKDSDGSTKIALIAIDRSILAWTLLAQIPTLTETAHPPIASHDRLRRGIERQLPNARNYQRPGFDTTRFD
jgi:hypothetical protein